MIVYFVPGNISHLLIDKNKDKLTQGQNRNVFFFAGRNILYSENEIASVQYISKSAKTSR